MKKSLFILISVFTLISVNVYADNALYIYRNDGSFNAFLDSRIDSISYSTIDTSGVDCNGVVTQLIYTADSLYRIPLSSIDSIAFTERPAPEIKSDVYFLTSMHLPYIKRVEYNYLVFDSLIPCDLLPTKGSVIVSEIYEGKLERGFAGRVDMIITNESEVYVVCNDVSITDIYDRLIITGSTLSSEASQQTSTLQRKVITTKVNESNSKEFNLNGFSCDFGNINITNKPTARLDYTIFIERGKETVVSMLLYHTHNLSATMSYSENSEYTSEPKWLIKSMAKLPYGLYARLDFGAFFQALGNIEMELNVPYSVGFVNGFTYNENGFTQVNRITKNELGKPTASVDMRGSLTAGLVGGVTLGFVADKLLSINGEIKSGVQIAADYKLTDYDLTNLKQDGAVYDILKDSKINLNSYIAVNMGYGIVGFDGKICIDGLHLPYEKITTLKEWYLLPMFNMPEVQFDSNKTTAIIKTKASRDLLIPVKIGVGLQKKNEISQLEIQKSNVEYRIQSEYPLSEVAGVFTDLDSCEVYKAFPVVELLGKEIHALPETMFDGNNDETLLYGEEVDLGLSVNWSSWNIGASAPYEYGNYYAWGETEVKTNYSEKNYKYWQDVDGDTFPDAWEYKDLGSDISGTQYDVATVKLGDGWRMPTIEEFVELRSKCKWESYKYNGVLGCMVTGPNGNSIFIPSSGRCLGTEYEDKGKTGYYWTSTSSDDLNKALVYRTWHNNLQTNHADSFGYMRGWGHSVRPVKDKNVSSSTE